jgi:hypothetical protein
VPAGVASAAALRSITCPASCSRPCSRGSTVGSCPAVC